MPELTHWEYALLLLGAVGIGVSKSGFSGVSMLHIVIYASVFGPRESTGVLLPLLIVGDVCAIIVFGKKADWRLLGTVIVPMMVGVLFGWAALGKLPENLFGLIIGAIILVLTVLQVLKLLSNKDKPASQPNEMIESPARQRDVLEFHRTFSVVGGIMTPQMKRYFLAGTLGTLAGFTTMLANAAGPIVAIYFLLLGVPKLRFIGTGAWLFLCVNLFKIPLSASLDLITWQSLGSNLVVTGGIPIGILLGTSVVQRLSQRVFDFVLLAFTAMAAIKMMSAY